MPKLRLKFKDWIWIKWVDSDYSPDWEHYSEKEILGDSRECQSIGLFLAQDREVIAFCQSSDMSHKRGDTVVHAQTTIPWVSVKEVVLIPKNTGDPIFIKKSAKKMKKV